ncbi:MAG: ATP synthase subunit I [Clostridiales bacterium]|nr:ATP synthase subunit I [Clostridiales bacterium]
MESMKRTQINVIKGVLLINSVAAIFSIFFLKAPMPIIVGLLFGAIMAILNFRLLYLALNKAVNLPPHKAQVYASSKYFMRYLVTGIVLFVSIRAEHINVLGTIFGLLSIKFVILKTELLNSKQFFMNIFKRREE